ncbi:MAG TPA: hypothetical protein RMH99_32040 [Sandaracinaceae bacterium LLY-WYZ-13_1]|nr:hypothetical protein [Sandaracinaceae bacterium LLY-WYZ-13_1]
MNGTSRHGLGVLALVVSAGLLVACNLDQEGAPPPPRTLNYPIALALSQPAEAGEAPRHLFVANSNFDLRYNTGSLMAIDLEVLDDLVAGCDGNADCDLLLEDHPALVAAEVGIGTHADGLSLRSDGGRLYLPLRSEESLAWIDFVDDAGDGVSFACGQPQEVDEGIPRCDDEVYVAGVDDVENERELVLEGDPVAVANGRLSEIADLPDDAGEFVLLAMRDGRVALFLDEGDGEGPRLVHVAEGFAENLVTVTMQPGTGVAWLTSSTTDRIDRVGISVDAANPSRSFLYDFGGLRVGGIDDGEDLREVQFLAADPNRAFVLSRRPEAVVSLDLARRSRTFGEAPVEELYEVGAGPSRLVPLQIDGRTYVLASCFDAQKLYLIDADTGALIAVVGGFSGPFELVHDEARDRVYLADFSTSQIRVIDLSPVRDDGTPQLVATIGEVIAAGSILD